MNHFGLTKERYNQMLQKHGSTEEIAAVVEEWGAQRCNKGYIIADYDCSGILGIEALDDVGAFSDLEAKEHASVDGVALIPTAELPEYMPEHLKRLGWLDTEENREALTRKWGYRLA